ncbi:unnamed protein product [Bemisia tabaci]|uniref:Phosducin domain-containing protein n=1 Tax=Bemisia tabaci TaxID=7038 RepID=A0A9P0F3U8_BEMTA|nr:PREDICTED: phosducin-like protein [Bemisia tabaci]CAH0388569.1 unnamed protein product [Bemisia tabaci]
MATLEDKILGEKSQNYCSSSESENEAESGDEAETPKGESCMSQAPCAPVEPSKWDGVSSNTGPKGVIKDWQRFKQLESERRKEQDQEKIMLMKKLTLTCKTALEEEKDKQIEAELEDLLNDEFLLQYQKQCMQEMLAKVSGIPTFGALQDLKNGAEFLDAIEKENASVTVVIHIYEENNNLCKSMNEGLKALCQEYKKVKFCRFLSSAAGMSRDFKKEGVPALLVYKGGQLIGNFVSVGNELGDEFYSGDIENFLIEHGMISSVPTE